jgi:5-methylcytosine-specific restriction endonuclease McrA
VTELAQLAPAKACTKCGITKPLDKFYLVSGRRQSRCKDCDNAQRRHRDHIRYTGVSDITPEQELAMRKRTRKCSLCAVYMTNKPGLPNSKHLDHILPLILGGTHTHGNVRIICRSCNLKRPKDGSDVAQVTLWCRDLTGGRMAATPIRRPAARDYTRGYRPTS